MARRQPLQSTSGNKSAIDGWLSGLKEKEASGKEQPALSTALSNKRSATDARLDMDNFDLESGHEGYSGLESEDDPFPRTEGMVVDKNCDQVRRQINNFIEAGGMKVGEFQAALRISSGAYLRFMRQSGRDKGIGSDVHTQAWAFFKEREMDGVAMPTKKKAKTGPSSAKGAGAKMSSSADDLRDIHLPGEETDSVLVFDTCDEMRNKMGTHLRSDGVTAAGFCRDIAAMYNTARRPEKIQSGQLRAFQGKSGPHAGCTSCVFYGAYVFFEKLRIKEGKPKSKFRLEMEKVWPQGFDYSQDRRDFWCSPGMRPSVDKYGNVKLVRA